MKSIGWLTLGLSLALAAVVPAAAAESEPKVKVLGQGPAYDELGKLAVMHAGRAKPLDTLAREEVRLIFGRETIKLVNAENKVVESWGPTAALFDWSVRPSFWDDQPIILVQYLPLKRLILADAIHSRLSATAEKPTTSPADKAELERLTADASLTGQVLEHFLKKSTLPADDRKAIGALAAELSEDHKWLTPRQLEEARVTLEGGESLPFSAWLSDLHRKKGAAEQSINGEVQLSDLEENGYDVGSRLVHYQAFRDRDLRSIEPMLVLPRPHDRAYLAYTASVLEKARKREGSEPTLLEMDAGNTLGKYWDNVPSDLRADPGTDEKSDAAFTAWLKARSAWVPLKIVLDSKPEELAAAGFDAAKMGTFLRTFKELEQAEESAPGNLSEAKARDFVAAARALGASLNSESYPSVADVGVETFFNRTSPFWTAPLAYGLATILLAVSLGFMGYERGAFPAKIGTVLYATGMLGLVGGILLEVFGFALRVRISGWAPVTNMYETVIWVSLVAAVLGLVFEVLYRKTFTALGASGLAMVGTLLAANVPLLDPNIRALQPVLQSNYWLLIHVLTEVSSYAAFLLAASLGLIATMYYLTATYRRSPRFSELALPLLPGIPMLAAGTAGLLASYGYFGSSRTVGSAAYYLSLGLAGLGGPLTLAALFAMAGEVASRLTFREEQSLDEAALAGEAKASAEGHLAASPYQTATAVASASAASAGRESGGVMTLSKPSVAEIRAMSATNRPKLDARGRSMQETASKIKPLANFIYRTMQVGVLLIAAGTFLGGWWADKSWGRFWGWDPKEVWALVTLLVYLVPLHGRFAGWFNTFWLVFASVFCSMSVIMAWYGVNFVLGVGLHSYGFASGGGQGIVVSVCLAVLALPVAAFWRRHLASKVPLAA